MHMDDSISITPAANGGFIITCMEKPEEEEEKSNGRGERLHPSLCNISVPYVAKDISMAMKILKNKLEMVHKKNHNTTDSQGVVKNAY